MVKAHKRRACAPLRAAAIVTVLSSLAGMALAGCGGSRATEQTSGAASDTAVTEAERAEYEGSAQQRLARLGAEIDTLEQRIATTGGEAKQGLENQLDSLRVAKDRAQQKLGELRAATADQWRATKQNLADLLDDIDRGFDRMRQRLRSG